MQKKVLALAVVGLFSGAAFAQTAVTFGGSIAMDVTQSSDHSYNATDAGAYKSKFSVDDSNWQGSRLWWKAQEDLGNGLTVEAYQQLRMRTDFRDTIVNRQSYLQLAGKSWGAIKAGGGFGNILDDVIGLGDAKGSDWGKGALNPLTYGGGTNDTAYNTVQYITPNFSGLTVKLNLSTQDKNATEADGNGKSNVRSYGLNAMYGNGPFKAGMGYLDKKMDGKSLKETTFAGMYDFGMFQLGGVYSHAKNSGLTDFAWNLYDGTSATPATPIAGIPTADWTKNGYRINVGFDITPMDHVGLNYSQNKVKFGQGVAGEKISGVGLAYVHLLSKRTMAIAEYTKLSMHEQRAPVAGQYQSIFKLGMRHDF